MHSHLIFVNIHSERNITYYVYNMHDMLYVAPLVYYICTSNLVSFSLEVVGQVCN